MDATPDATKRTVAPPPSETLKVYQTQHDVLEEHLLKNTRYVIYRNGVYAVGKYLDTLGHPGGEKAIAEYFGRDVTEKMHAQNHSKTAYRLLSNYKVGEVAQKVEYDIDSKTAKNGTQVLKGHSLISEELANRLATRFDLTKPIFPQLLDPTLTLEEYLGFITEPKIMPDPTKQIRIFQSDFFEFFSSTQWWHVPAVWLPVKFLILTIVTSYLPENYTFWRAVAFYLFGIFHWTITEYFLHRFLFHVDAKLPTNGWCFGLHFLIHGIHHAFPQDPGRLVFPIFNASIVAIVMLSYFNLFLWWPDALYTLAGFGIAYIAYDLFHYYTHHSGAHFFDDQRRYHMKHHHKNPNMGFGVTSKLWDYVFGTVLKDD